MTHGQTMLKPISPLHDTAGEQATNSIHKVTCINSCIKLNSQQFWP